MTNKEKYAKEILDVVCKTAGTVAIANGKPADCDEVPCKNCLFFGEYDCDYAFIRWAQQEYTEPKIDWKKLQIDTKILVRDHEDDPWIKAHFACYKDGKVFAYPYGCSSWTVPLTEHPCSWNYVKIAAPDEQEKYKR